MFYPADRHQLRTDVQDLLAAADIDEPDFPLKILIVPHAGYVYSGPIAAGGYRLVSQMSGVNRVVMLGPSHFVACRGLVLPQAGRLETPLGDVEVDQSGAATVLQNPLVSENAEVHRREHSLEVQLPFIQVVAPGVPVLPMLTGAVDTIAGADVVEEVLDNETLLLVSSDLSHYHDAATARRLDAETVAAIQRLDPGALGRESACGRTGIQIALHIARRSHYRAAVLDLRNSADTAGTPERVVGYSTIALGA
jgi:AmmeMemoRadiSam system protein B